MAEVQSNVASPINRAMLRKLSFSHAATMEAQSGLLAFIFFHSVSVCGGCVFKHPHIGSISSSSTLMPVFPIPYDRGTAVVLTDACLVVTSNHHVFGNPYFLDSDGRGEYLTPAEFRACNWRRVVMARYMELFDSAHSVVFDRSIRIRTSVYGVDLSDRLRGVSAIYMFFMPQPVLNRTFAHLAVPRMAWLGAYNKLVERRLALAMANHCRLGVDSLLRSVFSSSDVVSVILGEMQ